MSPHGDGWFQWERPIMLGIRVPRYPDAEGWAHVSPRSVPLEIGSTDTMTTYMHLLTGGGVARWAYGSTYVVLLMSSTFVDEVERTDDPSVRWAPEPMWQPSFGF